MSRLKPALGFLIVCVLLWTQTMLAVSPLVLPGSKACGCCRRMACCPAPVAPSAPAAPIAPARTDAAREVAAPLPVPLSPALVVLAIPAPSLSSSVRATTPDTLPAPPIYERVCSYLI